MFQLKTFLNNNFLFNIIYMYICMCIYSLYIVYMKKKNLTSKKNVVVIDDIKYEDDIFEIINNQCMKYKIDERSKL